MTTMSGIGEVVGSALVLGSTGAGFAAATDVTENGALSTVARTGAGVYTIALNNQGNGTATAGGGLARTEHDFIATAQGTVDTAIIVQWNSATQITVRTFTANTGVALDSDFTITAVRTRRLYN